jgi:choline dehydrogenase
VIVIGAGAGGLLCAAGLADQARVTVLEAGAIPDAVPAWMNRDLVTPASADWGRRDADTGLTILRGRISGGCTSINSAAALRPQPWDFDEWGVPGWSWTDVEPVLAAIEADAQFGDRPGHGDSGPIPVTRLSFGPIDEDFAEWAQARGHAWVEDQNSAGALGVGHWPTNVSGDTVRWGTHQAVLPLLRNHVELLGDITAMRLVIVDGRCAGVEVADRLGTRVLEADHVVVAGGSIETPLLLMRSGIGPADQLAAAGVPVLIDRPAVGSNLQDHPWATLTVRAADPTAPAQRPVNGVLLRYEIEPADRVEVHLYPHQAAGYVPEAHPAEVLVGIGLMRAVSRGSVVLSASGEPEIRLAQLSAPADRSAFLALLADADAYIEDRVKSGVFEEPEDAWWRADDLDAAVAAHLDTYGHLVGTCRMGTDADAVVDPALGVVGVEALTVADASVMPVIPRANTMLTTMMIGARAAQFVAAALAPERAAGRAAHTQAHPAPSDAEVDDKEPVT